jgi:hypothetical protein
MFAEMPSSGVLARLATTDAGPTLDCFGGYIQILSKATDFWVLRGHRSARLGGADAQPRRRPRLFHGSTPLRAITSGCPVKLYTLTTM